MATIILNGERKDVQLPITVAELIKVSRVIQPDMVSVQLNEEFVEKEDYDTVQVKEGDTIDFLYFMGGGQSALTY